MEPQQVPQGYQQAPQPVGYPPMQAGSQIKKHHSWALIIALIFTILLLFGAAGFGLWAFGSRQEYKDKSDQISAKAVAIAVQKEDGKKDNEFKEAEKKPLKTYISPEAYGSVNISYPKTWSAYVIETDRGSNPVDAYFHPAFVPDVGGKTAFALRLEITSTSYDQEMKKFESNVKIGKVKVTPYTNKNVPNVVGARVQGEITQGQQTVMILMPLRDKTIKISTEAQQFVNDFDNNVLANLKFVP